MAGRWQGDGREVLVVNIAGEKWPVRPELSSRGLHIHPADRADSVVQQPGVHTAGVEQVEAGQPPHLHPLQEVGQADHALAGSVLQHLALAPPAVSVEVVEVVEVAAVVIITCNCSSERLGPAWPG